MANHQIYGVGSTLFTANSGAVDQIPLYVVSSEFGIQNPDGTKTYFHGVGLTYDWANHVFTGGTISSILHYAMDGSPLDRIYGLNLPAIQVAERFLAVDFKTIPFYPVLNSFMTGDDLFDARSRVGGAIVNDTIYAGLGNDRVYGGTGNDELWGEAGNDRLYGGAGNDRLLDGDGDDFLFGEDGADTLEGYAGNDTLSGGAGNDTIVDQFGSNVAYGGDGDDSISVGTRSNSVVAGARIYGDNGNDFVSGGTGVDYIRGGAGNDTVGGAEGNDRLYGDSGIDNMRGGAGNDTVFGGSEADQIYGDSGADYLAGDAGNDVIYGGAGGDRILGGTGNDMISGDDRSFVLSGFGRDVLFGDDGDDLLQGNGDTDSLNGGMGTDTAVYRYSNFADLTITQTATGFSVLSGYEGRDSLTNIEQITARDGTFAWNASTHTWSKVAGLPTGTVLPSIASGTTGDDNLSWSNPGGGPPSSKSPDLFLALDGNDTITFAGFSSGSSGPSSPGNHGEATVFGGNGNDVITVDIRDQVSYSDNQVSGLFYFDGGNGNDTLTGGNNEDYLIGGTGNDVLRGNQGNDVMSGGRDADTFVFTWQSLVSGSNGNLRNYLSFGEDTITDFVVGSDKLQISGVVSTSVEDTAAGALLTVQLISDGSNGATTLGILAAGTILLQGVHGNVSIDDLLA